MRFVSAPTPPGCPQSSEDPEHAGSSPFDHRVGRASSRPGSDGGRFPCPPSARLQAEPSPWGDAQISTDDARINDRIRAREVFLVDSDGTQLGVRTLPEALAVAREQELDLVEVAANANPPVCRIMNHGRYKYEQEQRRKESRKKTTNVVIKEMKFRPKIDGHDYVTKMKHVERFLGEGAKVKLTIMFRGREVFHPELGSEDPPAGHRGRRRVRDGGVVAPPGRSQHDHGPEPDPQAQQQGPQHAGTAPPRHAPRTRARGHDRGRAPEAAAPEYRRPSGRRDRLRRSAVMPKKKTHRGAAKRFKVTGTGKIRRRNSNRSHLLEKKSSRRTRRLGRLSEVVGKDKKHVEKMLGRA